MSARDALHARLYKGPNENRDDLLDAYRAEVLAEAADVAREETHRLEAGNQDARAARGARSVAYLLRRLAEAGQDTGGQAPAGEPTQPGGVVQYGIRHSDGTFQPVGGNREYAAGARARVRATTDPGAALVQRTITPGPWTAVEGEAGRD